ncbi:MAG: hypothetical protein ABI068_05000 [Ktedonobacterales bacterium]
MPRLPQLPPIPSRPSISQAPHLPQLEEHRFRQQLERRVLTTTPDFTAGVMARLATTAATTATATATTMPVTPDTAPAQHSMPLVALQSPLQALGRTPLLAQVRVVGCIYAVSAGMILGTSLAIVIVEPNVVLTALVTWINWLVGLIAWLGMLTRMLIGSIGLLGVAYLLMLALLAPLALLALGTPRLMTALWREV